MFNRIVSFMSIAGMLIAGQIGFASQGFAANAPTPEMSLLENVIALEGQNLSQNDAQAHLSSLLDAYVQSAPAEGQQQRMEEALSQLGLYTPGQAHALMSEIESSSQTLLAKSSSQADLTTSVTAEISKVAASYPLGAQFSACDTGIGLSAVSGAGLLVGGLLWGLAASNSGHPDLQTAGEVITSASVAGAIVGTVLMFTMMANDPLDC